MPADPANNPASRYSRQTLLPQVGEAGQRALASSHAIILGVGALGTVAAELLCRAGVGTLTLIDRDVVELTNLQRQTLFNEQDAREGLPKAEAARCRLSQINSSITLSAIIEDFNHTSAERIIRGAIDRATTGGCSEPTVVPAGHGTTHAITVSPSHPLILLDCSDNFETRYLLNDLAIKHNTPLVYAGAVGTTGLLTTILPKQTPCLRCTFDEPPAPGSAPTCDTAGVLGPLTATLGALQAAEAIKLFVGDAASSTPRADNARTDPAASGGLLLSINLWPTSFRTISTGSPRTDCPCCALRRFDWLSGDRASSTSTLCGRNSIQITPTTPSTRINLAELDARLSPFGDFT
ncbi:MAG TPA: ThiF family adenylyltransferase, partial [Phycisphaerales bacterium]|nr:ThiF family adenylyltransferase [Phycisphaerales bacterium]